MTSERDDAKLVQATLGGDEEAYGELARRYRKAAFGAALSRLSNYDAALDIAQDALVAAYVQLPVLREPARFAAWLCRIANNLALIRLRRRSPVISLDTQEFADLPSLDMGPSELAEGLDEKGAVRQALSQLSEADRAAVILHYVSGYSHEEIAGMTGVTESSVKARLHRACRKLREEILQTMETMGDRLPDVELTQEVLEGLLQRHDMGEDGVIVHLGGFPGALPGMPRFTERTKEAIRRIAGRLSKEGCLQLYAPPHLPDGPAVEMLRSIGFENETEMLWYERDLTARVSAVPPLPEGFETVGLRDVPVAGIVGLLRAPLRKSPADLVRRKATGNPNDITEEWARRLLNSRHFVPGASVAVRQSGRPVAGVIAFGVNEWENWKYEPGTGVLWIIFDGEAWNGGIVSHALAASLKGLKKAGLKRAVVDNINPEDCHPWPIPVMENLGFRYIRSQWNLRLPLKE